MKSITVLVTAFLYGSIQVQSFSTGPICSFVSSIQKNTRSGIDSSFYSSTVGLKKHDTFIYTYRLSHLFMGWGPDPIWTSATVTSNYAACPSESSICLTLDVPSDVMEGYSTAGQYVQMKRSVEDEDTKPIFLAIASAPPNDGQEEGSNLMEFLIKKTDNNSWITSASESTMVAISQVMGAGFAIKEEFDGLKYDFPTQNVLLFANGSGIAPIRAAIESGQLNVAPPGKGGRSCRLYYGIRSPSHMAYADKFARWERAGVAVVPIVSRPEECKTEWPGRTGYVQNALEEDGVPVPRNSGALLCGVKGMAEAVTTLLENSGVFKARVLTNF